VPAVPSRSRRPSSRPSPLASPAPGRSPAHLAAAVLRLSQLPIEICARPGPPRRRRRRACRSCRSDPAHRPSPVRLLAVPVEVFASSPPRLSGSRSSSSRPSCASRRPRSPPAGRRRTPHPHAGSRGASDARLL
jgi:hypothetical protein